jgi:hypothetical protein
MCVRSKSYDQQPQILLSRVLCSSVRGNQRKRNFYRVDQGQLYWDYLARAKNVNYAQKAKDAKNIVRHILYIQWFIGETTGGAHRTLVVRYKNAHGKVAFCHMDSLNNFDNSASYALLNTPLYSQNRD